MFRSPKRLDPDVAESELRRSFDGFAFVECGCEADFLDDGLQVRVSHRLGTGFVRVGSEGQAVFRDLDEIRLRELPGGQTGLPARGSLPMTGAAGRLAPLWATLYSFMTYLNASPYVRSTRNIRYVGRQFLASVKKRAL